MQAELRGRVTTLRTELYEHRHTRWATAQSSAAFRFQKEESQAFTLQSGDWEMFLPKIRPPKRMNQTMRTIHWKLPREAAKPHHPQANTLSPPSPTHMLRTPNPSWTPLVNMSRRPRTTEPVEECLTWTTATELKRRANWGLPSHLKKYQH